MTAPNPSILDRAARAGDLKPEDVNPMILLYAPSGAGKTHRAVEGGRPFVLLTEANGMATIVRANPDARVLMVEDVVGYNPDGSIAIQNGAPVVVTSALDTLRSVIQLARSGELARQGFDRLVIDSDTELQRLFKDEILADKDGATDATMSLPDWGTLGEKMRRLHRTLRGLPIPVVVVALCDETTDADGNTAYRPSFEGKKTANEVAQFFSAIGFVAKKVKGDDADYVTCFDLPGQKYVTKSCGAVSGVLRTPVTEWIAQIRAAAPRVPKAAPEAAPNVNTNTKKKE